MKLWLTRQRNGDYMVTFLKPVLVPLKGTDVLDAYVVHGDPIGHRHMCKLATEALCKEAGIAMPGMLESVRVQIKFHKVD